MINFKEKDNFFFASWHVHTLTSALYGSRFTFQDDFRLQISHNDGRAGVSNVRAKYLFRCLNPNMNRKYLN